MTSLTAGSLAVRALQDGARGRVVALHRRAVNLLLDDGPLVGLLPAGQPIHPWALTVGVALERLSKTDPVCVSEGRLAIGSVVIPLSSLDVLELRLEIAGAGPVELEWLGSVETAAHEGAELGEIEAAIRGLHESSDPRPLIGLGPGLTPSGDDVLIGYLAGLELLGRSRPEARARRRRIVSELPDELERLTPRLSAQLLRAAAEGHYAEPILAVLEALGRGDRRAFETARASLLRLGHHSGRDTWRGLCESGYSIRASTMRTTSGPRR